MVILAFKFKAQIFATESFITPLISSLLGIKNIIVVHDLISFKDPTHKFFPKLIEKISLPILTKFKNNYFLFSTQNGLKESNLLFKLRKKNSFVFFPGPKFTKTPNKTKKTLITFVSTFFERKNHILLLKAFDQIKDKTDLNLCLVGRFIEPQISKINQFIKDNKLEDRVILSDYLSDSELKQIYKKTAILCNPSKIEGFGLQIIEALHMSIPCIVSEIPVFKEVFKNSCLYFEVDNAQDLSNQILFLSKNSELKHQLNLNSKAILKKYSFPRTLVNLNAILKKINSQ